MSPMDSLGRYLSPRLQLWAVFAAVFVAGCLAGTSASAQTGIAFIQTNNAVPQSGVTSVTVSFSTVQTVGNLNVVVAGWNDTTAHVQSVTDSRGNAYVLAVGPTVGGGMSQSIYYAKNIAAGSNTVTVTFDRSANHP